jgi:N-methylhydantoinase B
MKAGDVNRELLDILLANVRTPHMVEGDLRAQAAALALGARRLDALFQEHSLDDLGEVSEQIQDRAEGVVAAAIGAIPEGEYTSSVSFDGIDGKPITIRLRLGIAGGRVHADYDGTSPQVPWGLNCVYSYTYAYTGYALKCLLDPTTPNNDGCYRRFSVSAPEGSILHPRFPAAVAARHFAGHVLPVAVLRALADAAPEQVIAGGCVPPWLLQFYGTGLDDGPYSLSLALAGGQGAAGHADGLSSTTFPTNSSNIPVEVIEASTPLRFVEKALVEGSAGNGRQRGGLGQRVGIRNIAETPASVSIFADQLGAGPSGLFGGDAGRPGKVRIDDEAVENVKGRAQLAHGQVLTLELPGGGGFGPSRDRDPALVERDTAAGYTATLTSA